MKEVIFGGNICKALLNLLINRRIDKVEQQEQSPESILETGVGVKISVTDLSIVRTVVDRFAGSVELIVFSREEKTAVQTRVESAVLVSASSSGLDAVKSLVPERLRLIFHLCERLSFHLFQIDLPCRNFNALIINDSYIAR